MNSKVTKVPFEHNTLARPVNPALSKQASNSNYKGDYLNGMKHGRGK